MCQFERTKAPVYFPCTFFVSSINFYFRPLSLFFLFLRKQQQYILIFLLFDLDALAVRCTLIKPELTVVPEQFKIHHSNVHSLLMHVPHLHTARCSPASTDFFLVAGSDVSKKGYLMITLPESNWREIGHYFWVCINNIIIHKHVITTALRQDDDRMAKK